ncbi:MAG TPA: GNAT family N-acetyltransferase [Acidimicrobiales bacterium]
MAVQPPPERFRDVLDTCARGFGAPRFSDASAAREQTVWELDRAWVVEDGDEYVATATSYSFEMTVPGGARVPAAGVAQVAVLPTHRRQGRLREVMGALLGQASELGDHYAILNASDSGIYGRFGFGPADRVLRIELDTDQVELVVPTASGRNRLVDSHEAAPLLAGLYDCFGRDRPGAVGRSAAWWDLVLHDEASWRGIGKPFVVVHEDAAGEPDGYAIYRSTERWDRGHANGTVDVREIEAASSAVEAALWRFLCDIDLRTRIVAYPRPSDDSIRWRLSQPRRAWVTQTLDLLWVRPLDVAACLAGRHYAVEDTLVLAISDATRPDQAATYRVTGGPESAGTERTDAEPDLSMDVAVLGSIILGGIDASELAAAGRITQHRVGAVARAERFFRWRPAPFCSTTF